MTFSGDEGSKMPRVINIRICDALNFSISKYPPAKPGVCFSELRPNAVNLVGGGGQIV